MKMNALFQHITDGDLGSVKRAVEEDPSLMDRQTAPLTMLMWCAYPRSGGQPRIARWLIKNGANMDLQETGHERTTLMIACGYNQPEIAEVLIKNGANLDLQANTGWTALMFACRNNQPRLARMMVKRGADLEIRTKEGWTALMTAASHSDAETTQMIITYGADLNVQNRSGKNALMCACESNEIDNARLLIEAGTALDVQNRDGYSALMIACSFEQPELAHMMIERGAFLEYEAISGWTALMLACRHAQEETAQLLIQRGARVNLRDPQGWTPVQLARMYNTQQTVEMLVAHGAEPGSPLPRGRTALPLACSTNDVDAVRALIQEGADVNFTDEDGTTALMAACRNDQPEIAQLLIEGGANLEMQARNGWTALMFACRNNQAGVARMLIQRKVSLNSQSKYGWTALMLACRNGLPEIANELIVAGASLDLKKHDGWTALMYACGYDQPETAWALILNGADLNAEDTHGSTALTLARHAGRDDLAEMLIEHGAKDEFEEAPPEERDPGSNSSAYDPGSNSSAYDPPGSNSSARAAPFARAELDGLALLEACGQGRTQAAKALIDGGSELDRQDGSGYSALMLAARHGLQEIARLLVDKGAALDLRKSKDNFTALMLACRYKQPEIASMLVARGADINLTNSNRRTPLMLACRYDLPSMAQLLILEGADLTIHDNDGHTALSLARHQHLTEVIEMLVQNEAPDFVSRSGPGAHGFAAKRPAAVKSQGSETSSTPRSFGVSPFGASKMALLNACRAGRANEARALIKNGANVDFSDSHGWTALMLASCEGLTDIAQLLVASGASLDKQKKKDGWTALMYACRHHHPEIANFLIVCGARVDMQNCNRWTALIVACRYADAATVNALVARGADLEAQTNQGLTPLAFACMHQGPEVVRMLIDAGARVDIRDDKGRSLATLAKRNVSHGAAKLIAAELRQAGASPDPAAFDEDSDEDGDDDGEPIDAGDEAVAWPTDAGQRADNLISACREGREADAEAQIAAGAALNEPDRGGWTPLMYASRHKSPRLAKVLINHGADLDAQNSDGWTALMLACRFERRRIAALLLERGAKTEVQADQGWTALELACSGSPPEGEEKGEEGEGEEKGEEGALSDSDSDSDAEQAPSSGIVALATPSSCVQLCWLAGASVRPKSASRQGTLALAKSVSSRQDALQFLEFVGASPLASFLLNDLRLSRSVVLAFFQAGILTFKDCTRLKEMDLVHMGVEDCAQAREILRGLARKGLGVSYEPSDQRQHNSHQSVIDLHVLVAAVDRARAAASSSSSSGGQRAAEEALISRLAQQDDPLAPLAPFLALVEELNAKVASMEDLQAEVAQDPTRIEERDALRQDISCGISGLFAGDFEEVMAALREDDTARELFALCEHASNEATRGSLESAEKTNFQAVQDAAREAQAAVAARETSRDACDAQHEKTRKALRQLSAKAESLTSDRCSIFFSMEHPSLMLELEEEMKTLEEALFEELDTLGAATPAKDGGVDSIEHALELAAGYYRFQIPEALSRWSRLRDELESLRDLFAQASSPPDISAIDALRKEARKLRRKKDGLRVDLKYAREEALLDGIANDDEVTDLEQKLQAINLYETENEICKERARLLKHAQTHQPELLRDAMWRRKLGLADDAHLEVCALGLWLDGVTVQDFADIKALATRPGKNVFSARDAQGRALVLKTFNLADASWERPFCAHVVELAKLQSPHIARIEALFMEDARTPCLAMSYYEGGDLASWIRDNPDASEETRQRIARGMLEGLRVMHSSGLAHGHLRPEKVLLTSDLEAVLTDFDDAQIAAGVVSQSTQKDSGYLAPEILSGAAPAPTALADVFAAGAILKKLFVHCTSGMCELIAAMCSEAPAARPSAEDASCHAALNSPSESPDTDQEARKPSIWPFLESVDPNSAASVVSPGSQKMPAPSALLQVASDTPLPSSSPVPSPAHSPALSGSPSPSLTSLSGADQHDALSASAAPDHWPPLTPVANVEAGLD